MFLSTAPFIIQHVGKVHRIRIQVVEDAPFRCCERCDRGAVCGHAVGTPAQVRVEQFHSAPRAAAAAAAAAATTTTTFVRVVE